ncbi:transcription antitermination factor NusB [Candidatus Parcubacteria bacterium 4484_255]|nr:MAG: transcription antitermination factor NusB [Candidatus Parcubacteria bacterium 4484_255]
MSQRRLARTMALQVLSEWDFNKSIIFKDDVNIQEIIQHNLKEFSLSPTLTSTSRPPLTEPKAMSGVASKRNQANSNFQEKLFFEELVQNILKNIKKIDSFIVEYAPQWPIEKITLIDRNILRIGVFELLISAQTPPKVVINEAIEIAKLFGSETSSKFINGVLGTIYEKMKSSIQNSKTKSK